MSTPKRLHSLEDLKVLLPPAGTQGPAPDPAKPASPKKGKGRTLHIRVETGGRKGKTVTVVTGPGLNLRELEDLARGLKRHCGAGGTVKDGTIEVQGDQRARAAAYLLEFGFDIR